MLTPNVYQDMMTQVGLPVFWVYRGNFYASPIDSVCPFCKEAAVIELPPELKAEQTDGTTHVCHPAIGGCNHGFAKEEF